MHNSLSCIFDDVCIFLKIVLFGVERTWKDSCGGRRNLTLKGTGCNIWKFIMQLSCFSECFLGVMALLFALTLLKQPSSGYVQLRAWKDSTAWLQYVAILARCWYRSWAGLWIIESQSEALSNSLQSQILQICAVNHSSSAPEKIYVHFTHPLSGIKEIPGASCIDMWVGGGFVNDCYCSGGICPMARKPKLKEGEKVLRLLDWIGLVLRVYVKVYNGYDVMNLWYHELFVYGSSLHPQHVWIDGHIAITRTATSCHSTFWMQAPELKVLMFLMWEAWHLQNSFFHSLAVLKGRLRWKLRTSKMSPNVHFGYLAAFCRWWLWSRKMNRRSVHLGYKTTQIFGSLDNLAKSPNLRGWNASSSYVQDLWTSVSVSLVSLAFLVFEDPTGSLTRSESIRIKAAWHRFSARWKKQRNSIAV